MPRQLPHPLRPAPPVPIPVLEAEIAARRDRLAKTIDELTERLHPRSIIHRQTEAAKARFADVATTPRVTCASSGSPPRSRWSPSSARGSSTDGCTAAELAARRDTHRPPICGLYAPRRARPPSAPSRHFGPGCRHGGQRVLTPPPQEPRSSLRHAEVGGQEPVDRRTSVGCGAACPDEGRDQDRCARPHSGADVPWRRLQFGSGSWMARGEQHLGRAAHPGSCRTRRGVARRSTVFDLQLGVDDEVHTVLRQSKSEIAVLAIRE